MILLIFTGMLDVISIKVVKTLMITITSWYYIVDMAKGPKFCISSISIKEVIVTSILKKISPNFKFFLKSALTSN